MNRPHIHRALVLQGGGALGAYEAGVVSALSKKLTHEDKKNGYAEERPLFDIVAGASIGAVNAVILVSHVLNKLRQKPRATQSEAWQSAVETLEDFWTRKIPNYQVGALDNAWVQSSLDFWWNSARSFRKATMEYWRNFQQSGKPATSRSYPWRFFTWPENHGPIASGESIRRYYSYQSSLSYGVPNILAGAIPQPADMKFLNPFPPLFWRFDNTPAIEMIKETYWLPEDQSIQTQEGEPRLLLVAVDVQDCSTAVTFDSYPKTNGKRFSEYGGGEKLDDQHEKHVIEYDGVTPDHLLASMSTHQRFEFPMMKATTGEPRYFWDGAYLSNTPLREVLQMHREYWDKIRSEKVPDLEVYIVNLYPSTEADVPNDPDSIQDREVDIKFHDKTKYDLKVAEMTTDYVDLANKLIKLTEGDKVLSQKVTELLKSPARSKKRDGNPRSYRDLLEGRFGIVRKVYVERKDDGNTIFGKAFDFSSSTLKALFEEGLEKAEKAYDLMAAEEKTRNNK